MDFKMELGFLIHVYDHHDEKTEQTLLQQVMHTQRPVRDKKGGQGLHLKA